MRNIAFARTIGIDYSGADTPNDELEGLQVYEAVGDKMPEKVPPSANPDGNWTRKGIAKWLVRELGKPNLPTLVGIDHAFSFPTDYFCQYQLPQGDWGHFLGDFQQYWPTAGDDARVKVIRRETGHERTGDRRWFRRTDRYAPGAKSVFHFGIPGQVAPSTHAGIPWLRYIRDQLGPGVHFWPFDGDGWDIPPRTSAIVEVYPALWKHRFFRGERNEHEHDAYSVAAWLSHADQNGYLATFLTPSQSREELNLAKTEGWILGTLEYIY